VEAENNGGEIDFVSIPTAWFEARYLAVRAELGVTHFDASSQRYKG